MRNLTKSRDLVMSGPVQEDKYLLQTNGNTFIFSEITPFHFLLANLPFLENHMFYQANLSFL